MPYNIGDSVKFDASFDYQGPSYSFAKLRCAVGIGGPLGFDELCYMQIGINIGEDVMSWDRFTQRVFVILKNVQMGETYDTYAKLMPEIFGQPVLYWYGSQNVQMGSAYPDSEFANLSVVVS